jgi:beta-glucosidase-like glycosyl hydrolase
MMKLINRLSCLAILTTLTSVQIGCSSQDAPTPAPLNAPETESYGSFAATNEGRDQARLPKRLSRFFLVEQSSAVVSSSLSDAFRRDPPGGVVFWNFARGGWKELSSTITVYSKILKSSGERPSFFSIDYEGGGLPMSPSGRQIAGIQRFRNGFTDLVHGAWLGRSLPEFGTELCALHGRIMSKELSAVGVNYPLALVSDLQQRLFTVRGVSTDPQAVAACLSAYTKAVADAGPVVAVTKHYPGLGQNSGDTHDVESVSTARTLADSDRHLFPFRELVAFANRNGLENRLSIMSSHGKFPLIDSRNLTTESPTLLQEILRDRFQFQGVRVSDAMWMGGYGTLQGDALYAAYANAFVSGLDMLMIPGSRYGGALKAFTQISDGTAGTGLRQAIEARSKVTFEDFRSRFQTRATESLTRLDRTLSSLPYPHEAMVPAVPTTLTVRERARYHEILKKLDERWISQLPRETR